MDKLSIALGGRDCGQQKAAFWGEAALLLSIGLPAAGVFILWNLWVWTRWYREHQEYRCLWLGDRGSRKCQGFPRV